MEKEYNRREALKVGLKGLAAIVLSGCSLKPSWNRVDISSSVRGQPEGNVDYLSNNFGDYNVYAFGDCSSSNASNKELHLFFHRKNSHQKFVPPEGSYKVKDSEVLREIIRCGRPYKGTQFHTALLPNDTKTEKLRNIDYVPVWGQESIDRLDDDIYINARRNKETGAIEAYFQKIVRVEGGDGPSGGQSGGSAGGVGGAGGTGGSAGE